MRYLEVRRHAFTKKGDGRSRGSHLSQEGVSAARIVGGEIGGIAYVAVSPEPRTLETALAMGFAVDDTFDLGSGAMGTVGHHQQWEWALPYVRYRELLDADLALAAAADRGVQLWREAVGRVPDGAAALVVGHGGAIEPTLVAAVPAAPHQRWGPAFSHLDGVRLGFESGEFTGVEFRRYQPR